MFDVAKNAYINIQQFNPKEPQQNKKIGGLMGNSMKPTRVREQTTPNARMAKLAQRIRNMRIERTS
tara:strand:- start:471 stop:668 length:198 start_codon:yes stop_codon:yes gene_type:complete